MDYQRAPEAQRLSSTRASSGLRRMTLGMLTTAKLAEGFTGASEGQGVTRPGQVLAAFKAAAPHLGFSPRIVHAVDWLFTFTHPQDWAEGSRPIVWPSATVQHEALGIGPSQVKSINRYMAELGLVVMKDSPNGKRYGRRDRQGRIVEAYGFDLSPLFARMAEFQAVAEQGRALRERMRHLRRRTTIARKALTQILETAREQGLVDARWQKLESEGRALAQSLKGIERVEEMELGVISLERRQVEARERLENQLAAASVPVDQAVNTDPKGSENRPHITTTKLTPNLLDTVTAYQESKSGAERPAADTIEPGNRQDRKKGQGIRAERTDSGSLLGITVDELMRLAPKLRSYLQTASPAWPDIIEAADWVRGELGISKSLWGDACLAMGRPHAAIAVAIVSAKPAEHFTSSAGSYFHGMVERAKSGQLNLSRTIWGLRQNSGRASVPPRRGPGGGELWNS